MENRITIAEEKFLICYATLVCPVCVAKFEREREREQRLIYAQLPWQLRDINGNQISELAY